MAFKTKTIATNLVWQLLERFGAQIVTFIVSIVLARLLDPIVYGTVALITVFTSILEVFVDSGFGSALIQKKNADDLDFCTVFYFNNFISIVLYICMFFAAGPIASFYGKPELLWLTRVLCVVLLINGFKNTFKSYIAKNMQFKKYFFSTLSGTITAAVVGIVMAIKGFGPWALIAQYLTNAFIDTVILFFITEWKPKLKFSFERLKYLFSYGGKLLLSSTIEVGLNDARGLIIGKRYSSEDLAYYNKGNSFPSILGNNISQALLAILFPTFSEIQDDQKAIKTYLDKGSNFLMFVTFPMMVGMIVVAQPLILILLGEKWASSIIYLQLFSLFYLFDGIGTPIVSCLKASGRSGKLLMFTIIKRSIDLVLLISFMFFGVEWIAISCVLSAICKCIVNAFIASHYFNWSFKEQILSFLKNMIPALCMGIPVFFMSYIPMDNILILLSQILLGIILYIGFCALFKNSSFFYLIQVIKNERGEKNVEKNKTL